MSRRKFKKKPRPADELGWPEQPPAPAASPGAGASLRLFNHSSCASVVLITFLLAAMVFAVFAASLRCEFVSYDDPDFVTENDHVRTGLRWANVERAFRSDKQTSNWIPLTTLSHQLVCQLFGLRPWAHHLVNVLLHAANTALVFLVFRRMTGALWRSLFIAALFGLHPLRVESVTWVTERKDVLSVLFWLLTLWVYVRYVEELRARSGRAKVLYGLALLFLALGLMSKPMLVTVPCVLLLLDYWPLRRLERGHIAALLWEKVPFLLLAAVASFITFQAQKSGGAVASVAAVPLIARVENVPVSYCRYLSKLLCPANLSVFYPHPKHWPAGTVVVSALLLLGLSLCVLVWRQQRPYLLFGWLWFLGTLVPVIGLVQAGKQSLADRYTYVPSVGIFMLWIWVIGELAGRWRVKRIILAGAGAAVLLVFAAVTWRQIGYWQNGVVLFQHALQVTENNYTARNCLGYALEKDGKLDQAVAQFQEALRLNPHDWAAHNNLGTLLSYVGRFDEAVGHFREALRLTSDPARVHHNFGIALVRASRLEEAAVQLQEAVKLAPDSAKAHFNLGCVLKDLGRLAEAVEQFQAATTLQPDYGPAHNLWGVVLGAQGRWPEAIDRLQTAVRLEPTAVDFRDKLGKALAVNGRIDEAIVQFWEAVRLEPNSAPPHAILAKALATKGRLDEAIEQANLAVKLGPGLAEAHNQLGGLLSQKGQLADAIREFEEAVRLKPDYAEARNNLAAALNHRSNLGRQPPEAKGP